MQVITRIGLSEANHVLDAAQRQAEAIGVPQNIVVVDESGHLVAARRMDGAKFIAMDIAINKALTAAGSRKATRDLAPVVVPGQAAFGIHAQANGRFTTLAGGIPLVVEGVVVGAVGVSSGSTAEDQAVAEAGASAFAERFAGHVE